MQVREKKEANRSPFKDVFVFVAELILMSDDDRNVQVIMLNAFIDRTDKCFDGDEVYAGVYF